MAVDGDFVSFRAIYDELTDEIDRARYPFLPDHLRNWFQTIDTTPRVSSIVQRLQEHADFEKWWAETEQPRFMSGSGVNWPNDREEALGTKLLLFRAFAEKKHDIGGFGYQFIGVGNNINDNAQAVIQQIFDPMARELRRFLEHELRSQEVVAPAADRVVRLDHNSPTYNEVSNALEALERAIDEGNDFEDVDEKQQRIAEVSAVRRLLKAILVRIEPIVSLLKPLVKQFATKLKDTVIGIAVGKVVSLLGTLLSYVFSLH